MFFDKKHYHRDYSRYGDFNIKKAHSLREHGYAFYELILQIRKSIYYR
ncbi:MAG: DUF413 domain-containing protein [Candidatus Dasytiphilus stammeri]